MRRDKQSPEINRRGHRGWAGTRKSAVSVGSGAGMPEKTGGGGERRNKEGTF